MIVKSYTLENNTSFVKDVSSILFYGENLGLKNDFKKILKNSNNASFINLTQDEILKNEKILLNELFNTSLFNEKKIIFIEDCTDKFFKIIENYFKEKIEHKLILFSDKLEKRSKLRNFFESSDEYHCVPCYPDNNITLRKIVENKLKGFQGLNQEIVNTIISASNNDRYKLYNEIEKITSCFNNKKIEFKKINELLNISTNDDFNLLRDEILKGNKIKSNELLSNTIFEPEKIIFYLSLLNQRIHSLKEMSKLKKNLSPQTAITKLKPQIFWADKSNFLVQSDIWNKYKALKILKKTFLFETRIKSSSLIKTETLFKKLLLDICNEANAA